MTIEDRLIVGFADLVAIRFECRRCQSVISIAPKNWNPRPFVCPNCQDVVAMTHDSVHFMAMKHLADALKLLLPEENTETASSPFRIRLEITHPHGEAK